MKRLLIFVSIFSLLLISYSYAEDNKPFSGGIFLGGRAISLDHQSAKFNEYNGITPGLFGGGALNYDGKDGYYLHSEGAYLGDDDLYLKLKGGKWGMFKYSLYYTEFPHNLSFKDKSIFTSPGSSIQTFNGNGSAAGGQTNPNTWASQAFDYRVKRKDLGGSFDLYGGGQWFFNVDANRLERTGQMPWAATSGQASFKSVEFALPVDNTTINTNAQLGWRNKLYFAALSGGFSKFTNDAEFTRFRDPFTTTAGAVSFGTTVGAPDNKSANLRFTGTAKKLPFNSVFAVDAGYQRNWSDATILNTIDSPTGTQALTLNRGVFHGNVEYWNVGTNLTSNPIKDLTTKIYFKYLDKKNSSDSVLFTTPAGTQGSEVMSYQKTTWGADGTYRFMKNLKGILGYEYTDLKRRIQEFEAGETGEDTGFHGNESTIPETWEHKFTGQIVYNPFEWLGGRLKYQKLYRNTHFVATQPAGSAATDVINATLQNNNRRFDIGDKEQDMFKLTTDLTPLPLLDIALEYAYKKDNWKKSALGFQDQDQNEFIIDASYEWKGVKFFGFFDYDATTLNQAQRQTGTTPATAGNPNNPPDAANGNFNWTTKFDNKNYAYGIGTSVPIMKNKLTFIAQYDFEKNNGLADFTSQTFTTSQQALGINNGNIGIPAWDDYTRQSISARLKYDYNRDLAFVFGYLYTQFKYSDSSVNGYNNVVPGANVLLSGAYTDQSYKANIYYLKTIYRF